ncbi:MAG TPA: hypothetical protein VFT12_14210 [Thermoanaerobaculia bacterium]|nr:hypothetical protein [Thermoanaerobaculia bacterium]
MIRVFIAIAIYGVLAAFYFANSGAPTRVHVATACELAIGFLVPALFLDSLAAFLRRWKIVAAGAFLGALANGILGSLVVAKAEFFDWWYVKYPVLTLAFATLLFVHACLAGVARRVAAV